MVEDRRYSHRFSSYANDNFSVPQSQWNAIKGNTQSVPFKNFIYYYLQQHWAFQLPRIQELQRYYAGDNDIHYARSDTNPQRADNRISSTLARYIVNIKVGYQLTNPIKYSYINYNNPKDTGDNIKDAINDFNRKTNSQYIDKLVGTDLFVAGRAYELNYIANGTNIPKVAEINPATCFVIWSTDIEPQELCGVRYFKINVMGQEKWQVEIYTDDTATIYQSQSNSPLGDWQLLDSYKTYFGEVPITEYDLNNSRIGIYETQLDRIDAIDQETSNMANVQQDNADAILAITGKMDDKAGGKPEQLERFGMPVYLDSNMRATYNSRNAKGKPNAPYMVTQVLNKKSGVMYLVPYVENVGDTKTSVTPDAKYLTKQANVADYKTYIDDLTQKVLTETWTPNIADDNFSNNASGVAMAYKLWGSDQDRSIMETLFARGLHRRIGMVLNYLDYLNKVSMLSDGTNPSTNVTISFAPNLPKNDQEQLQIIQGLAGTNKVSNQTILDMIFNITGVTATDEENRLNEQQNNDDQHSVDLNNMLNQQNQNNGGDD